MNTQGSSIVKKSAGWFVERRLFAVVLMSFFVLSSGTSVTSDAEAIQVTIRGNEVKVAQSNISLAAGPLEEAVDNTAITITTGGNLPWFSQSTVFFNGGSAAQSGAISHSQSSWMETTATGPAILRFYWKVSSQAVWDELVIYKDGFTQASINGEVDWEQRSIPLNTGTNTLRWVYRKDGSNSAGSDAGWVDKITIDPVTAVIWSTGAANINWHDSSNWNPPFVPSSAIGATITEAANNPVISSSAEALNLALDVRSILTVNNNLRVYGIITVAGTLTANAQILIQPL